jgi:hypothetical protein
MSNPASHRIHKPTDPLPGADGCPSSVDYSVPTTLPNTDFSEETPAQWQDVPSRGHPPAYKGLYEDERSKPLPDDPPTVDSPRSLSTGQVQLGGAAEDNVTDGALDPYANKNVYAQEGAGDMDQGDEPKLGDKIVGNVQKVSIIMISPHRAASYAQVTKKAAGKIMRNPKLQEKGEIRKTGVTTRMNAEFGG